MNVILATLGTDGDVFPHLGLAATLRARGHPVTLAAPEPYRDRAHDLGLEFCPLVTADARLSHVPGIRCPVTVVPR